MRGSLQASDNFACIGASTARVGNSKTCVFDAISLDTLRAGVRYIWISIAA